MKPTLILGGARSGKSLFGETLASQSGKQVIYIATSHRGDDEMHARIEHHRQGRAADWITVEEPLALGASILKYSAADRVLIVDCLTLWLTNLLFAEDTAFPDIGVIELPEIFHRERAHFLQALEQVTGELILISNEVGLGVVPQGAISRCFADEAGRLNQAVAQRCGRVLLIAAGLPLVLKDDAPAASWLKRNDYGQQDHNHE